MGYMESMAWILVGLGLIVLVICLGSLWGWVQHLAGELR